MPKVTRRARAFVQPPYKPKPIQSDGQPELARSNSQDPIVAWMIDNLNPELMRPALLEIGRVRDYGVTLTPEIVQNIVNRYHEDEVAYTNRLGMVVRQPDPDEPVVYYMRIGNRVKIGTTIHLRRRVATLNPEEVMASEPGGYDLEKLRHAEFHELRTHGEWFKLEWPLTEHIERLANAPHQDSSTPTMPASS